MPVTIMAAGTDEQEARNINTKKDQQPLVIFTSKHYLLERKILWR